MHSGDPKKAVWWTYMEKETGADLYMVHNTDPVNTHPKYLANNGMQNNKHTMLVTFLKEKGPTGSICKP